MDKHWRACPKKERLPDKQQLFEDSPLHTKLLDIDFAHCHLRFWVIFRFSDTGNKKPRERGRILVNLAC